MGKQIVKQPNGKYAIWSSVVDDFVCIDCENAKEIIEDFMEEQQRQVTNTVERIVKALNNGGKPYYQFTKTFDECVEIIKKLHGEDAESLRMLGIK